MPKYLKQHISNVHYTERPRWGMAADGYTLRSGAPTRMLVQLYGSTRWRRVMCWQFSNAATLFVRIKGENMIVNEYDIPVN